MKSSLNTQALIQLRQRFAKASPKTTSKNCLLKDKINVAASQSLANETNSTLRFVGYEIFQIVFPKGFIGCQGHPTSIASIVWQVWFSIKGSDL